jgi:microsomal dipeptidase-like Zn-dependent dipeptidase
MRVVSDLTPRSAVEQLGEGKEDPALVDRIQRLILWIAIRLGSNKNWWSDYRITVPELKRGNVGLAMSVLYRPFQEMDLSKSYGSAPDSDYFQLLLGDLKEVEEEVETYGEDVIRLVHDRRELETALDDEVTALVHAVEGGFHLGDTTTEIEGNCVILKEHGVAYVTVAHLFYREVATNAPALPFLPDAVYRKVFPQPKSHHVTDRGKAVLKGLVDNRILIDISHMDPAAVRETFRLLDDELDPEAETPVVSTHAGFRCGRQQYMHDEATLLQIKKRGGVVGLIMAQHQLKDGIRCRRTKSLGESLKVIFKQIDEIARITGGYEHIALGTDFDGFIKPTMGGLESMGDLEKLEGPLRSRYGADTELMMSGNALRVLRALW